MNPTGTSVPAPELSGESLARADSFRRLFASRIVVRDGAMDSMIQTYRLEERDFRGDRFKSHPHQLQEKNHFLNLTRPDIIEKIHADYFAAGSDLVGTNTLRSTSIGMADHSGASLVREINLAAVAGARRAAQRAEAASPGRKRFVGGAIGSLSQTSSMSAGVNGSDLRTVTWDQLVTAYTEQIHALLDGGVDALLVEATTDSPDSPAALFAIENVFDQRGEHARVPVMINVMLTDAAARQTISALYHRVAQAKPFFVGIGGALDGAAMRHPLEELAGSAHCYTGCCPNAGPSNSFGGYDASPTGMARVLGEFAANGWVNLVGGCNGATPAHIAAIAHEVNGRAPRMLPQAAHALRLSNLGPRVMA